MATKVIGKKSVVNPHILVQEDAGTVLAHPLGHMVEILRPVFYDRVVPGTFEVTVYAPDDGTRSSRRRSRPVEFTVDISSYIKEV